MNRFSLKDITARHDELILTHRDVVKECEAFCDMMTREPTFARLCEQAGLYISRLSDADREDVLVIALELAWEFSSEFDPAKTNIVIWWDGFLKHAMNTRSHWECRFRQGRMKIPTDDIPRMSLD
jgi:hypothetical protein